MPYLGEIEVTADLFELLQVPRCVDISLPKPQKLEITLPTGGKIQAITDASKAIPNDCSLVASLMLQISPFLTSIDCLLKILGIIKPLIKVVNGLGPPPNPIKLGEAIPEFVQAAEKLACCLVVVTPVGPLLFLRDLLNLLLKALNCIISQLNSIIRIMNGLTLKIRVAKANGNASSLKILECAQENAAISAQHMANSIEVVSTILELAGSLMGLAGLEPIPLPKLGRQTDIKSLQKTLEALEKAKGLIQAALDLPFIKDAVNVCPS
jgi:hypothetical protein